MKSFYQRIERLRAFFILFPIINVCNVIAAIQLIYNYINLRYKSI